MTDDRFINPSRLNNIKHNWFIFDKDEINSGMINGLHRSVKTLRVSLNDGTVQMNFKGKHNFAKWWEEKDRKIIIENPRGLKDEILSRRRAKKELEEKTKKLQNENRKRTVYKIKDLLW